MRELYQEYISLTKEIMSITANIDENWRSYRLEILAGKGDHRIYYNELLASRRLRNKKLKLIVGEIAQILGFDVLYETPDGKYIGCVKEEDNIVILSFVKILKD